MQINDALIPAFNDQITLEMSASTVYRQLAIEMDVQDLPGMAAWLRRQADEELVHANKFIDHVIDRGAHPRLGTVEGPTVEANTPLAVFQAALAHEEKVSQSIRDLYLACEKHGDLDSRPLLNWFLEEQIEEEATVGGIVAQVQMVGADGAGLLRLDAQLGGRPEGSTEPAA